jgi:hypothetical protein
MTADLSAKPSDEQSLTTVSGSLHSCEEQCESPPLGTLKITFLDTFKYK